jgi:hypothetical protein
MEINNYKVYASGSLNLTQKRVKALFFVHLN